MSLEFAFLVGTGIFVFSLGFLIFWQQRYAYRKRQEEKQAIRERYGSPKGK